MAYVSKMWTYTAYSLTIPKLLMYWCFENEKALGETQTLRTGCSKAKPKIFAPAQTPFPGVQDSQNLISWRWSLPSSTDPVWWRSMHTILSYRGNIHTHTNTHTNPQTGPITIHCTAKHSVQYKKNLQQVYEAVWEITASCSRLAGIEFQFHWSYGTFAVNTESEM